MKRSKLKRYAGIRVKKPSLRKSRSTPPLSPDDLAMFATMRLLGCVACRINREIGLATATFGSRNLEIHHVLSGGRRIGHHATMCLCHYHHQGKRLPYVYKGYAEQSEVLGPSMAREPRRFREIYGTQESLLDFQRELLRIAAEVRLATLHRLNQEQG